MFIFVIGTAAIASPLFFDGPRAYMAINFVVVFGLQVTSLCQITAIALPPKGTGKITPHIDGVPSDSFKNSETGVVPS